MYVGVDVGGTFTDIAINFGDGENVKFYKLPSSPKSPETNLCPAPLTLSNKT